MISPALNILGIAKKAGRVDIGDEQVSSAARAHSARLIILASDAADNTARRVRNLPGNGKVVTVPFTKDELGAVLGKNSCAVVSVSDARLAKNFLEKLEASEPGSYTDALDELSRQAERVDRRQAEKKAHEKNRRKKKS